MLNSIDIGKFNRIQIKSHERKIIENVETDLREFHQKNTGIS